MDYLKKSCKPTFVDLVRQRLDESAFSESVVDFLALQYHTSNSTQTGAE
jgi:hypothetical protein